MEEVFSTAKIEPHLRYAAWREAICDVYLKVDVESERRRDYEGFIRESRLGSVTITDTLLSQQQIARQRRHMAQLDKDCYYIQIIQHGQINVVQAGSTLNCNAAAATVFCASEPYLLQCPARVRAYYIEVSREAFDERFSCGRAPIVAAFGTGVGLGRIAVEFCDSVVTSAATLSDVARARVGEELIDIVALAVECGPEQHPFGDRAVQRARLRSVKIWILEHLSDSTLSLERVARSNHISLRQLHYLFELSGTTPSDWIRSKRLERCYEALVNDRSGLSVTDVAFQHGFSSSAHFSNLFRRNFGVRPSEVKRGGRSSFGEIKPV